MTKYGQVILGPPGSGKTTYCEAVSKLLIDLGRKVSIINLDPANDVMPYTAAINIYDLVRVDDIMTAKNLGPNGALVYCMELLEANIEWLMEKIDALSDSYLIFDFPGQAELYTHHTMIQNLFRHLEKKDVRLCSVFLIDAHYASDPGKYISALLLTLNSMLQMEVATVNVLSKVDQIDRFGKLHFGLDFYTDVLNLDYLLEALDDGPITKKYRSMNKAIADLISDYSLVSFLPLSVENRHTLLEVTKAVDKANGYIYGSKEERNIQRLLSCAVGAKFEDERIGHLRDTYTNVEGKGLEEEEDEDVLRLIASQNVKKET